MSVAPHVAQRRRLRSKRLKDLGFGSYNAYLDSPHWRALRAQWLASNAAECMCGETEQIQLHHLTYERLGNEDPSDFAALCPHCHNLIHELGVIYLEQGPRRPPAYDWRECDLASESSSQARSCVSGDSWD